MDGYNKDIKLDFERQGKQHYKFHEYFHKNNPELFERQKELDDYKRENCKKDGIALIEIGYEWRRGSLYKIKIDEMENYIRKKCIKQNIIPPQKKEKINWRKFDISPPTYLIELQELAKKRNGKLLSNNYFGELIKLKWYCNKHHNSWYASPNDIRGKPSRPNGTWCPQRAIERHSKLMKKKTKQRSRDKDGKFC